MHPFPFLKLPTEIRRLIYAHAYPRKEIEVEPLGGRFHPRALCDRPTEQLGLLASDMAFGDDDEQHPSRIMGLFAQTPNPDVTVFTHTLTTLGPIPVPPTASLARGFTRPPPSSSAGRVARILMCSKCGGPREPEHEASSKTGLPDNPDAKPRMVRASRGRCWACMETGHGLLHTSRFVFNDSIDIYYDQVRPCFSDNGALLRFIYCVWSHGHANLVRQIGLRFGVSWVTDLLAEWREGGLRHALPGLKSIWVDFDDAGSYEGVLPDIQEQTYRLEALGPILAGFYKNGAAVIQVQGLALPETIDLVRRTIKSGDLTEWNEHNFRATAAAARGEEYIALEVEETD